MIDLLASPSVCVIDEDPNEFPYILKALNDLHVGCVHIKGDDTTQLPEQPFKGLRLVFTDLYLSSGAVGKDMASHTANVFRHVVSSDTAPVLVVIWSKHKDEIADSAEPADDQKTEADLFIDTLLESDPKYRERLIFLTMTKPVYRPDENVWVSQLKTQISEALKGQEATHALWIWESLVKEASVGVSEGLTSMSQPNATTGVLGDRLKVTLQLLAKAQSEGALLEANAPRHLTTVLAQLLVDQLEHKDGLNALSAHGAWLVELPDAKTIDACVPKINGGLLTAATQNNSTPFLPGMVYKVCTKEKLKDLFGVECHEFLTELYRKEKGVTWQDWLKMAEPVMVEISSACDIDQGDRLNAILLAGLILPVAARANAKSSGAFEILPNFALRWPMDEYKAQDSFLIFCSRFKVTLPSAIVPAELKPWFRLRELRTASLRNWHAGHASRVGYVSL